MKRILTIIVSAIAGIVLLALGGKDFLDSKALQSEGKSATADVTDADERSGRRGRRKYYLTVSFKTEKGDTLTSRARVSEAVFDEATASRKVNVTYLPEKPAVHRVGPKVSTDFRGIAFGALALGFAGFSVFRRSDG